MIVSFKCEKTKTLFETGETRYFSAFKDVAIRKLTMLEVAKVLIDLRTPPGNQLESLYGDREGQHSIRINGKWRICFVWTNEGATDVEIVDYHESIRIKKCLKMACNLSIQVKS